MLDFEKKKTDESAPPQSPASIFQQACPFQFSRHGSGQVNITTADEQASAVFLGLAK